MKKFTLGLLALLSLSLLEARETVEFTKTPPPPDHEPWFTGPLLTPSAQVVPEGHVNFEPYIYWFQNRNKYNQHWHSISIPHSNVLLSQNFIQIGIYKDLLELDLTPQFAYNKNHEQHMWRFLDFPFALAIQLYSDPDNIHTPKLKLRLHASVPCGKYDRLNPEKLGTDIGGTGSWYPNVGLVFSELFHTSGVHYLSTRVFVDYGFGTPAHIHGVSIYGGTPDTRGTAYAGNFFQVFTAMEYSFTQEWVFAMDLAYIHTNKSRFSGKKGGPLAPKIPLPNNSASPQL